MNAAEAHNRVDAWLDAHMRWAVARGHLVVQWRTAAGAWGADSPAAKGLLLALAREAWRLPGLTTERDDRDQWSCRTRLCHLPTPLVWFASEVEALVAALESATIERIAGGAR